MKKITSLILFLGISLFLYNCTENDDFDLPVPTGNTNVYELFTKAVPGISGSATFVENTDASITIVLDVSGTPVGGVHPSHIHFNTALEGGDIAISLDPVNGNNGTSVTTITSLDNGTSISYSELLNFDGYINVHLSSDDLGTIVAQGDIGQNALTGNSVTYDLGERAVPGISGDATFHERVNGEVLAEIMLNGTPAGGVHPAHIHENTAAQGGGVLVSFNPVNGDTGMSTTNIDTYTYSEIENIDGYINVHLSADDLGTIVAQGDIGQNALTGNSLTYDLGEKAVPGISGDIVFSERVNGDVLAEIMLNGTPTGGVHPAHIHENTAAQGGGILVSFSPVNGDTGMSVTNIDTYTYSQIENMDGYVNVHLSSDNLGTIVAQGDIGQNDLTGESKSYTLSEKDVAGISGTATFYKRENGTALAILNIMNTPAGGVHPAHIHLNNAATGGGIAFSFNPVNGDTGMSTTQLESLDDNTAFAYDDVLTFNGYINVHLSATQLSTIVAQGNIGSNE